jgi:deoxyadenosine/deoxycytidine kinase
MTTHPFATGTIFKESTYNCLKMAGITSFIGASGVGKTSLVRALHARGDFALGLESHAERPFQALFKRDPHYALANQVDFLLYRAEQERLLRLDPRPALVDGGLDLDFHGFTRLFHARGWLTDPEFDLVRRLYTLTRDLLPPPDLIVHLTASDEAVRARLATRDRINIASAADASLLASFLDEWLDAVPPERILRLDVTHEPTDYSGCIPVILARIDAI